jgi:hypothetical protein
MRERPHSGIAYRHDIVPMGSATKVVLTSGSGGVGGGGRAGGGGAFAYRHASPSAPGAAAAAAGRGWTYNLHSDDSFQFFGKRGFNFALAALLECAIDAASSVRLHDDKTALAALLPYEMRSAGVGSGDATVGGLSFLYGPGPEWTRACKYLLANLKHLVTYRVLHLNFSAGPEDGGDDNDDAVDSPDATGAAPPEVGAAGTASSSAAAPGTAVGPEGA